MMTAKLVRVTCRSYDPKNQKKPPSLLTFAFCLLVYAFVGSEAAYEPLLPAGASVPFIPASSLFRPRRSA